MEQISFFSEDKVNYTLAIFYEYHLYETKLTEKSFESEFVEFDMLGEVIQEGVLPNKSKKIDDFLRIRTSFHCDDDQQILFLDLELTYQKGRLKPRSETFDFELKKKTIDNQTTFENVMRSMEKTMNLAHIRPQSFNLFVEIDWDHELVSFKDEIGSVKHLVKDGKLDVDFLDFVMKRDSDLQTFFANRQHSQQVIEDRLQLWTEKSFDSYKIIEILCNYISDIYFVYFVSILNGGRTLMLNVDPKKQPTPRNYFVVSDLTKHKFDPLLNYRILEKFIGVQRKQLSKVELIWSVNSKNSEVKFFIIENDSLVRNRIINIGNKFYISANTDGEFEGVLTIVKKESLYKYGSFFEIEIPNGGLKITRYPSGKNFDIHLQSCSFHSNSLSCNHNCPRNSSRVNDKFILQFPSIFDPKELFLLEQFS